jgi:transketolase C-terminal domain/subunit
MATMLVSVEEHSIIGGLGSALAECLAAMPRSRRQAGGCALQIHSQSREPVTAMK